MFYFKKKSKSLPCLTGKCLYEYGMSNRDIEGMPFAKDDKDERKCPKYGHVCPHFMEQVGLSVGDLNIRATIHCGFTAKDMISKGEWKLEEMGDKKAQIESLLKRYDDILERFPQGKYPKYYFWEV